MTTLARRVAELHSLRRGALAERGEVTPELYDDVAARAAASTTETQEEALTECRTRHPNCPTIVSYIFTLHVGSPSIASLVDVRSLFTPLPSRVVPIP